MCATMRTKEIPRHERSNVRNSVCLRDICCLNFFFLPCQSVSPFLFPSYSKIYLPLFVFSFFFFAFPLFCFAVSSYECCLLIISLRSSSADWRDCWKGSILTIHNQCNANSVPGLSQNSTHLEFFSSFYGFELTRINCMQVRSLPGNGISKLISPHAQRS